ncbi:SH3 domain-containing protein [Antarctobacter heliothermus]|uniref:SH3 domain-containing protein n=1 Tax=Antarctobacter heliothermus TaxID=74033 RepID=A0A239L8U1_9RHOB|nr:SH3 domain-containing protein [Antarctobacter heliothermus]SNT25944.1 SH3 domain-containing protein [Antarctobacter heliothermus]
MVRTMVVTFAVLGWSWYALSGGRDFVPGGNGVSILADVDTTAPRVLPDRPALAGLQPIPAAKNTPDPAPDPAPRVTSLSVREPLSSKSVKVTVPPVTPAESDAPIRTAEITPPADPGADPAVQPLAQPVDEIALALAGALPAEEVLFDPEAPMQRIAGLGTSLPLGTKMGGALAPEFVPEERDVRVVSASRVNLRDGPATSYEIVAKLDEGVEVEVLDDTGDGWVKLRVVGAETEGWMSDDFLNVPN